MKLADLRRLSIRRQTRIRFRLQNGLECVITEHGVAEVPALKGPPGFNLEDELASANQFVLEGAASGEKKNLPGAKSVSRDDLARMLSEAPASRSAPDHDDE